MKPRGEGVKQDFDLFLYVLELHYINEKFLSNFYLGFIIKNPHMIQYIYFQIYIISQKSL